MIKSVRFCCPQIARCYEAEICNNLLPLRYAFAKVRFWPKTMDYSQSIHIPILLKLTWGWTGVCVCVCDCVCQVLPGIEREKALKYPTSTLPYEIPTRSHNDMHIHIQAALVVHYYLHYDHIT